MRITAAALFAALTTSGAPAAAQSDRLQPDFTFRSVTAPQSGSPGRRITIQIDPDAPSAGMRLPAKSEPDSAAEAGADGGDAGAVLAAMPAPRADIAWFWQAVSPALADSGPGRLRAGLRALETAPEEARFEAPSLQGLSDIARAHGPDILAATVGKKVSPALVVALISVESGGRIEAVSGAGAEGLMQLMPDTAKRFSVADSLDPVQNIRGGVAYLDWLMGEFDADPILVLAGYNAGEGSVRTHQGVPPFAETRAYVPKILAAWQVARGLCVTPPELVSDGCVFAVDGGAVR